MMQYYSFPFNLSFIWPLVIVDLVLKGFALWRASKNNQPYWFVGLLFINSFGVLPLIYLLAIDNGVVFKSLRK